MYISVYFCTFFCTFLYVSVILSEKQTKFTVMYRIIQKFTEIHRNSQKFSEIHRNSQKFSEIHKKVQKRTVMYRNVTEKYIFYFRQGIVVSAFGQFNPQIFSLFFNANPIKMYIHQNMSSCLLQEQAFKNDSSLDAS